MADSYITVGSTGVKKKIVDLGDGTFANAVAIKSGGGSQVPASPGVSASEVVLAGAAASIGADGRGLITTVPISGVLYVRLPLTDKAYERVDWRVKSDKAHAVTLYRAASIQDSIAITCATFANAANATVNGVLLTMNDTAATAYKSTNHIDGSGASDTLDAAALADAINAGAFGTVGAGIAVGNTATVTVDGTAKTYTAAAAAIVPSGVFNQAAGAAAAATSLALCINHKDTFQFTEDTTAFAGTNPATEADPTGYALSIELIADHNTHTASTVWHYQTTAAVSTTAATTTGTFFAQVNDSRTAMLAHYADATAHGVADAVGLAAVQATTASSDAATALALVNVLAAVHLAHVATARARALDTVTINGLTYTGHSATDATARKFVATPATAVSNIGVALAACINDRDTVTFTTAVANDSFTVTTTNTTSGAAATYTFTGKTSTADYAARKFSVDTGDNATATSVAAAINHSVYGVPNVTASSTGASGIVTLKPTKGYLITTATVIGAARVVCYAGKGVPGVTAVNATGTVSLTRDSAAYTITHSTTNGAASPHKVIPATVARGCAGVTATARTAEVGIARTWALGVTAASNSANVITGTYGCPGVLATSAAAVTTIVPSAVNGTTALQAITGTAAGAFSPSVTTLATLIKDGAAKTGNALNSTTAGTFYEQYVNGWPQAYLGFTSEDAGAVSTITVAATKYA